MNGIHISQVVSAEQLRQKVQLYAQLMDITNLRVVVTVSGTFKDTHGELLFLENFFYPVDVSLIFHKYLTVKVDGEYIRVYPDDGFAAKLEVEA